MRRSTSRNVPASTSMSATSSLIELVPQSMAATRVTVSLAGAVQGPAAHQSGSRSRASSPSGLTPATGDERVRDQDVQALHPVGHSSCRDTVDLRHLADRIAGPDIGHVGRGIAGAQVGVAGQAFGHLAHQATGLEGADRPAARGQVR